ncbi:hypothetical protein JCM9279_005158 [Rhodotorula babjevae]
MTGLHRRGSSAALYVPVTTESAEMNESFSSANRLARPRTASISPESTRPTKADLDDEPEEKDAFIPTTRYERPGAAGALGWRDASGRTSKGRRGCGWKGKLVVLLLVGGSVGAAAWFAFFRPDSPRDDAWLEAYKPGWWRSSLSSAVAEVEATATAAGLKANVQWDSATGALGDSFGTATSRWTEATQAAASYKGVYNDDYEGYTDDEYATEQGDNDSSELSASSFKDAAVAGAVSVAASELVSTLLDNGTLAAYKWHEALPALGSAHSQDGRLLVVGDLHGTHRSLVSLLKRLSFSPSSDTLLHVGDIVGKSALNDSLTTVSLLRKLGAKGVRGNHDQRVLEWRKWMEAYGPLDPTARAPASLHPSAAVKKVGSAIKNMQQLAAGKKQQVQSGFSRVAQSASSAQDRAASKLRAAHHHHDTAAYKQERAPMVPRERKVKRSFMTWLAGDGTEDDDDNEPALSVFEEPQDEVAAKDEAATVDETDVLSFDLLVSAGAPAASKSSVATRASSSSRSSPTKGSSSSSSSSSTQGGRRPFGRPTTLASASSVNSASTSSQVRARPSSSSTSSSTSSSSARASSTVAAASAARLASPIAYSTTYDSSGALVGASYAHLDPSLTPAELSALGVVVPEGWEWGGDHFEIARHLSSADVAYLEQLPLTLYIDEIKSYVVHAGMVPWSSLDRTLSRVAPASTSSKGKSSKKVPASLDSTSPLSFSPSSSLARLLAQHSSRTALLLDKLNTSPFTLLNMRTLTHRGGAAHNAKGVKGPPGKGEWAVSAKGRKAGKGAMPWWGVWEEGMKECGDSEACEKIGVVYGHWAGQGLQVQDHSIGLDTGCVYGRRLSALVVALSPSSSSTSGPLSPVTSPSSVASSLKSSAKSAASSLADSVKNVTSSSSGSSKKKVAAAAKKVKASASAVIANAVVAGTNSSSSALEPATARAAKPKSHPKWTAGGMQRVKGSASAAAASLASSSTSTTAKSSAPTAEAVVRVSHLVDSASFEDLDLARPSGAASSSSSSSSADDDAEALITDDADPDAADKPWWRPWKRAPPQGRPGVAPWGDEDAVDAEAEERSAPASLFDDDEEEEVEDQEEQDVDAEGASSAARAQAKKAKARAAGGKAHALALAQQDEEAEALIEDDAAEEDDVAALVEADELAGLEAEDDDEWVVGESAFAQERVVLAAAEGKVAWVVSVDCAAEADIE